VQVQVQRQVQVHVYRLRLESDHHAPLLAEQHAHQLRQLGRLLAHANRPLVLLWRQL
jgi:hypothetical protein